MAKHRILIVFTLLIILGGCLLSCSKAEQKMRRDRHWAKEYLNSLGREHYPMVLVAAAQSKKVTRIPSPKQEDYSFAPISTSRSEETIKLLSRMGLDMDFTYLGKTPLMLATIASQYSIVQLLLQLGANPLRKDEEGNTALDFAEKDSKIAQLLQEALDNIHKDSFEIAKPHKRKDDDPALLEELAGADSLLGADTLAVVDSGYRYLAKLVQSSGKAKQILIPQDTDTVQNPTLRTAVQPVYPENAKLRNLSGRVVMEVEVLPNGSVEKAKVIQSDDAVFDAAALNAVTASRFTPAQKGGFPARGKTTIEARFEATSPQR